MRPKLARCFQPSASQKWFAFDVRESAEGYFSLDPDTRTCIANWLAQSTYSIEVQSISQLRNYSCYVLDMCGWILRRQGIAVSTTPC